MSEINFDYFKSEINEDKMPKWMLNDHTDEQLKKLYEAMPFVRSEMPFEEYKAEWERQRKCK